MVSRRTQQPEEACLPVARRTSTRSTSRGIRRRRRPWRHSCPADASRVRRGVGVVSLTAPTLLVQSSLVRRTQTGDYMYSSGSNQDCCRTSHFDRIPLVTFRPNCRSDKIETSALCESGSGAGRDPPCSSRCTFTGTASSSER